MTTKDSLPPNHILDDEDDQWIPLMATEESSVASCNTDQAQPPPVLPPIAVKDVRTTLTNANNSTKSVPAYSTRPPRKERKKLTARQCAKLKGSLLDHPLDQSWQRYLVHLAREVWDLDLSIRLGIMLALLGVVLQLIVSFGMFPLYHYQTLVLAIIFAVSTVYVVQSLDDLVGTIKSYRMKPAHLRYIIMISLLVPTYLEARTLVFLSMILYQAGWGYSIFIGSILAIVVAYRRKYCLEATPRQNFQTALYILYGGALWVSLLHCRLSQIPKTAGPFFLSSGTLLLSSADSRQFVNALRNALRFTLRDTLAHVSDSVQQDEMLQLAMLRWIVDYWSTTSSGTETTAETATPATSPFPFPQESTVTSPPLPGAGESIQRIGRRDNKTTPGALAVSRPNQRLTAPSKVGDTEITWNDLLPMLDMTTHQMEDEVHHSSGTDENDSVNNLRQMIATMDVDQHAQPAVEAYRHAVKTLPPTRELAVWVSVLRRCPACLVLLYRFLTSIFLAMGSSFTLIPFVALELSRVLTWSEGCHRMSPGNNDGTIPVMSPWEAATSIPSEIDAMSVLISPDSYTTIASRAPLQVWFNVQSSIHALETGLVVARCVQTTAIAVEFASNLKSLTKLGCDISEHGWTHGLIVLGQELIQLQSTGPPGGYFKAIEGLVQNGGTIARNFRVLAGFVDNREEKADEVLDVAEELPFDSGLQVKSLVSEDYCDWQDVGDSSKTESVSRTVTKRPVPAPRDNAAEAVSLLKTNNVDNVSNVGSVESDSQSYDSKRQFDGQRATYLCNVSSESRPSEHKQAHRSSSSQRRAIASVSDEVQDSMEGRSDADGSGENGDDWVKWLGGGLAVVGAVAGAAALVNGKRRSSADYGHNSSESTVRITRLPDDEGNDDDWVSTPQ